MHNIFCHYVGFGSQMQKTIVKEKIIYSERDIKGSEITILWSWISYLIDEERKVLYRIQVQPFRYIIAFVLWMGLLQRGLLGKGIILRKAPFPLGRS